MVYVDDMQAPFRGMVMCHMLADTDEELHAMAERIGMPRRAHQGPPKHDSHYDLPLDRRALALAAGAIEITWRQAGAMNYRRRLTGHLGDPAEALEWMRRERAARRL